MVRRLRDVENVLNDKQKKIGRDEAVQAPMNRHATQDSIGPGRQVGG